jgi:hypothetical protein
VSAAPEAVAHINLHFYRADLLPAGHDAIVGSGPNVNVGYYRDSGRQMEAWDLVVMDYGGSLHYMIIDIIPIENWSTYRTATLDSSRSSRRAAQP